MNFTHVTSLYDQSEITFIQMQLDAEKIRYQVEGEHTVAVNPLYSGAIGGVRLMVHPDDIEAAQEIVREYREEKNRALEAQKRTCPQCGCTEGDYIKRHWTLGFLIAMTLGAFTLLFPLSHYRCPDCHHTWR